MRTSSSSVSGTNTFKMRFSLVLLLFVDVTFLNGQQRIEELQHILLRLSFPPFYNNYIKSCCKLYPGGCYKLMDSAGYTCDFLRGRVTKSETNGWVEFQIINVLIVDGGYYRCGIEGAHTLIYTDYYFEVYGSNHQNEPLSTTITDIINTQSLPSPTGPFLYQDHSDETRSPGSFALPLALVVSITVLILLSVIITLVYHRVKTKSKQPDTCGETLYESLTHEALEANAVVYTTVNFRPHQLSDDMKMDQTPPVTQDSDHSEMVEYSTLAF